MDAREQAKEEIVSELYLASRSLIERNEVGKFWREQGKNHSNVQFIPGRKEKKIQKEREAMIRSLMAQNVRCSLAR